MSSNKVALGSFIMVAKRMAVRLLSVVSTLILARLLLPSDFGLLALVLSFTALIETFTEFNFDLALVRRDKVDDSHYNTAWTLNVLGNAAVALVLVIVAPFFADFARAPEATLVMQVVALCIFVDGWQNIGMIAWRREMKFAPEFRLEFWRKTIEVGVTVAWAWQWPSVWALVGGMLIGRIVGLVLTYRLHPMRPRFGLIHWREMAGFSGFAVLYGLLHRMALRTDYFLISRLQNLTAVGLYTNAQVIAQLPTMELVRPINVALFSGFSNLLNDPPRLREAYMKARAGVLLVAIPSAVGIIFVADAVVRLLLGEKWLACIPLLQGLVLAQVLLLSSATNVSILMALGRMKGLMFRAVANLLVRPAIMYVALTQWGFEAVPYAILAAVVIQVNIDGFAVRDVLKFDIATWFKHTWRPFVATGIMSLALWAALPAQPATTILPALFKLLTAVAIAVPLYAATAMALWHLAGRPAGLEQMTLDMVRKHWARLRPR